MLSAEFITKSMPLICCEQLTKKATVSATSVVLKIFFNGWLLIIWSIILSSISEVNFVCISAGETELDVILNFLFSTAQDLVSDCKYALLAT